MTVKKQTSDFTYVILQSDYPVSYLPEYSSGRLRFDFQNTTSTPGIYPQSKPVVFQCKLEGQYPDPWSCWMTAASGIQSLP